MELDIELLKEALESGIEDSLRQGYKFETKHNIKDVLPYLAGYLKGYYDSGIEEIIRENDNAKLVPSGLPNQYWQGDKLVVRINIKPDELA